MALSWQYLKEKHPYKKSVSVEPIMLLENLILFAVKTAEAIMFPIVFAPNVAFIKMQWLCVHL